MAKRRARRRPGQPSARKGERIQLVEDRVIKKKRFTLRQSVEGANYFQIGPQFLGYPLALGVARAIKVQMLSQPRASEETLAKRARRAARGGPRSISDQRWLDTGRMHDQLEVKFQSPDKYHVKMPTNRLQPDPEHAALTPKFRRDVPVAGDATELINHPEVRQGVLEVLALLVTEGPK